MLTSQPDLSAGFIHKGRIVYALEYWLETPPPRSRHLIVWLTPSGDAEQIGIVHSDPCRCIVTTKPGEQILVRGQVETVKEVNVYRAGALVPSGVTGGAPHPPQTRLGIHKVQPAKPLMTFSIRDILWLMVVVAVITGWVLARQQARSFQEA